MYIIGNGFMGAQNSHRNLIEKICWCYYIENLTQEQIAKRFSISRLKVVSLMQEARELNTVTFTINKTKESHSDFEISISDKYKLDDAFIVPTPKDSKSINEIIGLAASNWLNMRLQSDSVISIGYGNTVSYTVNALAAGSQSSWSAISLTGGVNCYLPNTRSDIFKAKLYLYPAPLLVSSSTLKDELMKHPDAVWINKMGKTSSMTVFGLGGLNEGATVINNGLFDYNEFIYLKRIGAVGDILGHFINAYGEIVDAELDRRLISTPLNELKERAVTVGVAGGPDKVEIIRAALLAGFVRILITDEQTAKDLL